MEYSKLSLFSLAYKLYLGSPKSKSVQYHTVLEYMGQKCGVKRWLSEYNRKATPIKIWRAFFTNLFRWLREGWNVPFAPQYFADWNTFSVIWPRVSCQSRGHLSTITGIILTIGLKIANNVLIDANFVGGLINEGISLVIDGWLMCGELIPLETYWSAIGRHVPRI